MQFATLEIDDVVADNQIMGFEKSDVLDAVEILTIAIMGILVILLVLRPMVGKLLETSDKSHRASDELEEAALLAGRKGNPALPSPEMSGFKPDDVSDDDEMIDMQKVDGQVKASSIKKVEDIVDSYPAETVNVLRNWMAQE